MMRIVNRAGRLLVLVLLLVGGRDAPALAQATVAAPEQRSGAARDEFVPLSELAAEDQLPSAPLLVGAYTVAWVALLIYVLTLWRRLGRVEQELREARRLGPSR